MFLPLALIASFAALAALPHVRQHDILSTSFWGWTTFLLVWLSILAYKTIRSGRRLSLEYAPRKQHYLL